MVNLKFGYYNLLKTSYKTNQQIHNYINQDNQVFQSFLDIEQDQDFKQFYITIDTHTNNFLGYMIVNKRDSLIYCINTRVPKLNISKLMIDNYEKKYKKTLIPVDIINSSKNYWKKIGKLELSEK